MTLRISCAFAPSTDTPRHIALAEQLGYARAWCYDSPALYSDVWMTLALAAERTTRIGLGPAVLVPSLRHPVVTAAAIATLHDLAPGRVAAAMGTGFSGRYVLGQRRMPWRDVEAFGRTLVELLAGKTTRWEGQSVRLLEREAVPVPLLVAADGPKGRAVAAELGQGIFVTSPPGELTGLPDWRAMMVFGTVLDDGEPLDSEHVWDAAGYHVAMVLHALYEQGATEALDQLPGGEQWRTAMDALAPDVRHLALHERHLLGVNDHDAEVVRANLGLLPSVSLTGTAEHVAAGARALAETGLTELVYQPCGPSIPDELERFRAAVEDVA